MSKLTCTRLTRAALSALPARRRRRAVPALQPLTRAALSALPVLAAAAYAAFGFVSHAPAASTPAAPASAVPAAATLTADWPQWRGPARDDLSKDTGLLKEWPRNGPPLAWEAKGLGSGYGGVSVAGGKIFVTGDAGGAEFVHALSASTGKELWSAKIGPPGSVDRPGSRATPTVDGELLYTLDPLGDLTCLKVADGKEVWHVHLEKDLGGAHPGWGYAESPLVDGNLLICTPGGGKGTLAALDKKTGVVAWRSDGLTDPAAYSSPVAAEIGRKHQVVQLTQESVSGVAADTGKVLWRAERKGATAVIPTPIVHDNFVYVTSGYHVGCNLFKIDVSGDTLKPEKVYANKVMTNHHGGVILYGDDVYGYSDDKGWTCQKLADGEAVWKEKQKLGKGAIAYADNHFYLRQEDGPGTVVLIDATPDGYKEHGRFDPPDRSKNMAWPHPVITGGKLYLRDQDVLLCYDVKAK